MVPLNTRIGSRPPIELADRAHQLDAAGMRQPQVEHDEVDLRQIRAHAGQQLGRALHRERGVAGAEQSGGESVPHERGVVGDDDGFGCGHGMTPSRGQRYRTGTIRALALIAEFIRFSL